MVDEAAADAFGVLKCERDVGAGASVFVGSVWFMLPGFFRWFARSLAHSFHQVTPSEAGHSKYML